MLKLKNIILEKRLLNTANILGKRIKNDNIWETWSRIMELDQKGYF